MQESGKKLSPNPGKDKNPLFTLCKRGKGKFCLGVPLAGETLRRSTETRFCFLAVWLPLMSMESVAVALVSLGCGCCLKHREKCLLVQLVPVSDCWALHPQCLLQEKGKTVIWPLKAWCDSEKGEKVCKRDLFTHHFCSLYLFSHCCWLQCQNELFNIIFCNEERMSRKTGGHAPAELGGGRLLGQSFASARRLLWVPWAMHPAPGAVGKPSSSGAGCAECYANPHAEVQGATSLCPRPLQIALI